MPLALKPQKRISEIDFEQVELLSKSLNCDKLFAQILYNRGLTTPKDCQEFLYPDESSLLDPFSIKNMDKLIARLEEVKKQNKTITVYGDYDVDGISATAILHYAFTSYGIKTEYYIPDRHSEGYGLNDQALEKIFNKTDIVLTVDCGIASNELIKKYTDSGKEIIVTDHHTIGDSVPDCLTIKPGQPGDEYENPELCGAGIAFKIAQALIKEQAFDLIDFACVATIADVVPLKKENRYIVKKGLEKLNISPRDCFSALLEVAEFSGKINTQTVGFTISPRLNAAGRMDSALKALELLLATGDRAKQLATELNELNKKRQDAEKRILEEAENEIRLNGYIRKNKVLVVGGKNWDDGVIGICAARLLEKYKRPTIMFSIDDSGIAKGSGRSFEGVDLYQMLSSQKNLMIQFGGHKMAAGMSLEYKNMEAFREGLNEYFISTYDQKLLYPVATYDAKAKMEEITTDFCQRLDLMEPTGCDNPEVTLRIDNCIKSSMKKIGSSKSHLKLILQDETGKNNAVAFNYNKHNCDYFSDSTGSAIVKPEINCWQGISTVNLKISDFKETENIKPRQKAEYLTACFYSRLNILKTGKAPIKVIDDPEELHYMISDWDSEDISGTLIFSDHPEYAAGCVQVLQDEAPRFDISFKKPINENCGYNALVIGADIDNIDFSAYKRVIFYDMLNTGYADMIFEKAPWIEVYALKVGMELFDTIFEEYKNINREVLLNAYRQIIKREGQYLSKEDFLLATTDNNVLSMPVLAVATEVFNELGFITVTKDEGFKVIINKDAPKRSLEESRFYLNILKSANRK